MDYRDAAGRTMKTMSAREAKNGFGLLIDTARAEPVRIEKHGRGVVVVLSVEEYERLSAQSKTKSDSRASVVQGGNIDD
jgi:prevent-host-death family protein